VDRVDDIRADGCLYKTSIFVQRASCSAIVSRPLLYTYVSQKVHCGRILLQPRIAKSGVELTLKTLGTVTVSLVDSPLAEMTVTVGLDMVSRVGGAVVSIADLGVVVVVAEFGFLVRVAANRKNLGAQGILQRRHVRVSHTIYASLR
jgi:hypothetical protein